MNFFKQHKTVIILLAAIFTVTLGYALYFQIRPAVDAAVYDQTGYNISQGIGFRYTPELPIEQDEIISFHTPLYEYFLAGIYTIFGHHYSVVWFFQALLHTLSALFLFLICRRIFPQVGHQAGLWAAGLFGFYPDLIEVSAMLLTETLSIFFLIFFSFLFVFFYKKFTWRNTFFLGLVFGLTILVRSTAGLFLPVLLFYFLKEKKYLHTLLFLFMMVCALTPWTVRNYVVYDKFLPTSANAGYNFWVGNRVGANGEGGNFQALYDAQKEYGIVGANDYAMQQFKAFVKEHPGQYIKLTALRTVYYFSFIRPLGFWFYNQGISQFIFVMSSALASVIVFTSALAGIFFYWFREKKNILARYFMIFTFLTAGSVIPILVETRYRMPIYGFLTIFAGAFIAQIISQKKINFKYLLSALAILGSLSLFDVWLSMDKIIEKIGTIFYS